MAQSSNQSSNSRPQTQASVRPKPSQNQRSSLASATPTLNLKRVFLASLVFSGIGFWALGTWVGQNAAPSAGGDLKPEQKEQLSQNLNQALEQFSQLVASSLHSVKSDALLLRAEPNRMDSQRKVLLLAEAPIEGNALGPIATFYRRSQRDFPESMEQTLLGKIYAKLHHAPSQDLDLAPVRLDEGRPEEKLWLTFRDQNVQIFALIDPPVVFELSPFLSRAVGKSETTRAYLVSDTGSVLVHTLPSMNGTSMAGSAVYTKATTAALHGDPAESVGFEGTPVFAQFRRAGNFPIQMAVEEKVSAAPSRSSWDLMNQFFSLAKSIVAILILFGAFRVFQRLRRYRSEIASQQVFAKAFSKTEELPARDPSTPPPQLPRGAAPQIPVPRSGAVVFARPDYSQVDSRTSVLAPPRDLSAADAAGKKSALRVDALAGPVGTMVGGRIIAAQPVPQPLVPLDEEAYESQIRAMKAELLSYQQALKLSQHESELLAEFEAEAARIRDPKLVSVRMVSIASRLCASPALFFGYEDRIRACRVLAESGVGPGRIDGSAGFVVHESTLQWLQAEFSSGRWPSLSEYPPLSKLLLERLGVAHFEAWPLMGNGPLGRLSGKPRMLGVLVILQSSVDSYAKKDSLKRMLRSTGLIYENTLLAR